VLNHCHMGINRGPSAGYAVLLAPSNRRLHRLEFPQFSEAFPLRPRP
jgi:hypothetical protein